MAQHQPTATTQRLAAAVRVTPAQLLDQGSLPSCALGNDTGYDGQQWHEPGNLQSVRDAEVVYRGKVDRDQRFDFVVGDGQFFLPATTPVDTLRVGDSLWLSRDSDLFVLRAAVGGELVLAGAYQTMPDFSGVEQRMNALANIGLRIEQTCVYEQDEFVGGESPKYLHEAHIGSSPAIASGRSAQVSLDGRPYNVWFSALSERHLALSLSRAP